MKNQIAKENRKILRPAFWGFVFIFAAVILILDGVGVQFGYGINAWRIIVGILLLAWLVTALVRRKFSDIFIPIGILFLVFEAPIAHALHRPNNNLLPTWTVIVASILLTIGFGEILKPAHTGSGTGNNAKSIYLSGDNMDGTVIHDNIGIVQIYIENKDAYTGGGMMTITDNLGNVFVHLPDEWDVITQTGGNLGKIEIPTHAGTGEKLITLAIKDNLGNVEVIFDK